MSETAANCHYFIIRIAAVKQIAKVHGPLVFVFLQVRAARLLSLKVGAVGTGGSTSPLFPGEDSILLDMTGIRTRPDGEPVKLNVVGNGKRQESNSSSGCNSSSSNSSSNSIVVVVVVVVSECE